MSKASTTLTVLTRAIVQVTTLILYVSQANSHGTSSQFAAQVRIASKLPSLLLEEMETHFDGVQCSVSTVTLFFSTPERLRLAHEELSRVAQFILVTSHEGCNKEGERDTHMLAIGRTDFTGDKYADLHSVSALDIYEDGQLLVLSTVRIPWKHAVHSITVDFGSSDDSYDLREWPKLQRRQATTTASVVASPTNSLTFPTPTSSGATQATSITEQFNRQWIDKAILPPDGALGQLASIGPSMYVVQLCEIYTYCALTKRYE